LGAAQTERFAGILKIGDERTVTHQSEFAFVFGKQVGKSFCENAVIRVQLGLLFLGNHQHLRRYFSYDSIGIFLDFKDLQVFDRTRFF
jgi:hypothetical protein